MVAHPFLYMAYTVQFNNFAVMVDELDSVKVGVYLKNVSFLDSCTGQGLVPNHRQLYITVKVVNQGF